MELLSQPTAPFRESQVANLAARWLEDWGVPHFNDPWGNLVVGAANPSAYKALLAGQDDEPARMFIAHMDHPGFHGERWLDFRQLQVKWYGGSPRKHLRGASVWLSAGSGYTGAGTLGKVELDTAGRSIHRGVVRLPNASVHKEHPRARSLYGGFKFRAPVWRRGRRLYTKAADDLVGVFCILETARRQLRRRDARRPPMLGILTRGEEVGFVGATAHLELGWWRHRPPVCISLEASRTLPGARIGAGPVIRLGDRQTVFDPTALQAVTALAKRCLGGRYQRRIMDGGSCEGTVSTAFGIPTLGLSVPLGNYHNQGFEGGPGCRYPNGPAPEFVHLDDLEGQLTLCNRFLARGLFTADPWQPVRRRLAGYRRRYQRLLSQ